ncbi:hypothetical protein FAM18121_01772 [Lacticaseibacillus paracasei]|uniref:Uncharacterized protein n=1 Tax=Lacticaseibacillus paracasei TaxID=1597 RepID=A0A422M3S4_LACPA|nr:hypothetical protein FAM18121_01772 [Lacticaseibacillus paracasei]RND81965.1 hypothetical protein FAM18157_01282 [Lacticaseibacillus paracasei]
MSIVAHKKRLTSLSRFLCALINLAVRKNLIDIGKRGSILVRVTLLAAQAWEQSLLPDDDP